MNMQSNNSIFFTDNPRFDLDPLAEAFAEHLEYTLAKDRLRAIEAGFDQHLTKPAAIDAVVRAITGQA